MSGSASCIQKALYDTGDSAQEQSVFPSRSTLHPLQLAQCPPPRLASMDWVNKTSSPTKLGPASRRPEGKKAERAGPAVPGSVAAQLQLDNGCTALLESAGPFGQHLHPSLSLDVLHVSCQVRDKCGNIFLLSFVPRCF